MWPPAKITWQLNFSHEWVATSGSWGTQNVGGKFWGFDLIWTSTAKLEESEEFRIPTITKPSFSRPTPLARQGSHLQVLEVMGLGKIDANYGLASSPVHRNFSSTPLCLIIRKLRSPDRWSNLFEEQKLHWFMHGQIPKCQVLQWLSCLAMATSHLVAWL
jgi:hypothetical protein